MTTRRRSKAASTPDPAPESEAEKAEEETQEEMIAEEEDAVKHEEESNEEEEEDEQEDTNQALSPRKRTAEPSEEHALTEFQLGDLVWAKSGAKKDPFWPALVVDPREDVPEGVRKQAVPGRLCVMFYGPPVSKKRERDYGWIGKGNMFPFMDYLVRFENQTLSPKNRPQAFKEAVEEAVLVQSGLDDKLEGSKKEEAPLRIGSAMEGEVEAGSGAISGQKRGVRGTRGASATGLERGQDAEGADRNGATDGDAVEQTDAVPKKRRKVDAEPEVSAAAQSLGLGPWKPFCHSCGVALKKKAGGDAEVKKDKVGPKRRTRGKGEEEADAEGGDVEEEGGDVEGDSEEPEGGKKGSSGANKGGGPKGTAKGGKKVGEVDVKGAKMKKGAQGSPLPKLQAGAEVKVLDHFQKDEIAEIKSRLCDPCNRLFLRGQFCPLCLKVWMPNEAGDWAQCDECEGWIHASCDNLSKDDVASIGEGCAYVCVLCTKSKDKKKPGDGSASASVVPKNEPPEDPAETPEDLPESEEGTKKKEAAQKAAGGEVQVPEEVQVQCLELKAMYLPAEHKVMCKCAKECSKTADGFKLISMSEFELHAGSRRKYWKESVSVVKTRQTLFHWLQGLAEEGATGLGFQNPRGKPGGASKPKKDSTGTSSQKPPGGSATLRSSSGAAAVPSFPDALTALQMSGLVVPDSILRPANGVPPKIGSPGIPYFERLEVGWTSERCAVCNSDEDQEDNKFFICSRCDIGVHEECYGVPKNTKSDMWMCRPCAHHSKAISLAATAKGQGKGKGAIPQRELRTQDAATAAAPECCLCPVKGGALKATTIEGLWAHLVCALWLPEPSILGERLLQPIDRLTLIDLDRFKLLSCCVCRQPQGACMQCDGNKCLVAYHPMCAMKAGFHMDVVPKQGRDGRKQLVKCTFCPKHRAPYESMATIWPAAEEAAARLKARGGSLKGSSKIVRLTEGTSASRGAPGSANGGWEGTGGAPHGGSAPSLGNGATQGRGGRLNEDGEGEEGGEDAMEEDVEGKGGGSVVNAGEGVDEAGEGEEGGEGDEGGDGEDLGRQKKRKNHRSRAGRSVGEEGSNAEARGLSAAEGGRPQ